MKLKGLQGLKDKMSGFSGWLEDFIQGGVLAKSLSFGLVGYFVITFILCIYFSQEPDEFSVTDHAAAKAEEMGRNRVTGYTTTATLIRVMETLLDKPGGYLSNDVLPPFLWLDNMPNWEYGVVVQSRDLVRALRKDFSRSQSQSTEDKDLVNADPQLHYQHDAWALPATESEYADGIQDLERYLLRLSNPDNPDAQFFARADNLRHWLAEVESRLGSLSQRLSASVGQKRLNTDLAGEPNATQSTQTAPELTVKTPIMEIDDEFYKARGSAWALIHFLKAIEVDFIDVLQKKNALVSLRQIIRELEATQETVWSPMILNGNGFGLFANHSLVMANYISRANAAIIDLRKLLEKG